MNIGKNKKKVVVVIGTCASLVLIGLSLATSVIKYPSVLASDIYDKEYRLALEKIGEIVPEDEKIIVSSFSPQVRYYTHRVAQIPWGADSEESVIRYMIKEDYKYLLVYEGVSEEPLLSDVFSKYGTEKLGKNFEKLATFDTNAYQLHLFQIRPSVAVEQESTMPLPNASQTTVENGG